ncbi:MAG: hypothetical protein ACKVGW_05830 [Verrucomicrobiia bacterium]
MNVLVLYTDSVKSYHSEEDGIRAHVQASFSSANMAFENSSVDIRLRFQGLVFLDYDEDYEDMGIDLDFITESVEIQKLRDEAGADLVCLYRGRGTTDADGEARLRVI